MTWSCPPPTGPPSWLPGTDDADHLLLTGHYGEAVRMLTEAYRAA
ncbi:hypothetical protein OOK27_44520 [Streptomyces canus]|nr:hypothetical protein [Streptomyces canus]MCX5261135.1 hypothetical protein [Streptomyces canus]